LPRHYTFAWRILFINFNVQYKDEQIGQTILPDINLSLIQDVLKRVIWAVFFLILSEFDTEVS
jgi:uncharacterized protein (DUF486 family)